MTQSYNNGGDFDHFYRPHYRNMPPAAYYDRAAPYAYYEQPRQGMRQEYPERVLTRTMIHEPEGNETNEQTRRRIAVAVSYGLPVQSRA